MKTTGRIMIMKKYGTYAVALVSAAAILLFHTGKVSAQNLAVKTNALMWGALTPNLGVELVTGERTSLDLSAFGHKNPYGMTSKVIGLQPEFRFWLSGRPMVREYIGIGALLVSYDMTLRDRVFDGDAAGLGITGGYVLPLGKRWNIEFSGSFGLVYYQQKKYFKGDNYDDYFVNDMPKANSRGYELLPIDLGITFTYIIK